MSAQNLPPDLLQFRDATDRALKAYQENHNKDKALRLEETLDRRRLTYMTAYMDWVGGDPVEKEKMKDLITAIENHWGWGEEREGKVA